MQSRSLSFVLVAIVFLARPCMVSLANNSSPSMVKVGALLAFETTIGKVAKTAIEIAVQDVNASPHILPQRTLYMDIQDTTEDPVKGAFTALKMLRTESIAIVGPQTSTVADMVAFLADHANVPLVTFAAANPSLSTVRHPFFLRIGPSDSVQMQAVADIVANYGWKELALVYVDDDMGQGAIPALNHALHDVDSHIADSFPLHPMPTMDRISDILANISRLQTRVVVVHVRAESGKAFFKEAHRLKMIDKDFVWIITNALTSITPSFGSEYLDCMQGVLGIRARNALASHNSANNFIERWQNRFTAQFPGDRAEINIYGLQAYDAVWSIAYALDKIIRNESKIGFSEENYYNRNSFDVWFFKEGQNLKEEIVNLSFNGMSGAIGNLGYPMNYTYDVINIGDGRFRRVGSWSESSGLETGDDNYNQSSRVFESIIWPNKSESVPRGWKIPATHKKLRIGVPWNPGFPCFVNVAKDGGQAPEVSGFAIDIFEAVVKRLGYPLEREYIPHGSGEISEGYYDDLVYQVYLKNYDMVVGDMSILANRSKYVEFSQPFTEMGLVITVRMEKTPPDWWTFLRPFNVALWTSLLGFIMFVGIVVWLLEGGSNKDTQDTDNNPVYLGSYAVSIAFFAQMEKVNSNSAKMVLFVWLIVVGILMQSYTASLSSILTRNRIYPQVQSVRTLIEQRYQIGFRRGSFFDAYLHDKLGFERELLVPYGSVDEYVEALKKGPNNGGVAAVFDTKVFSNNILGALGCKDYTVLPPPYKTGGNGFVFQKGSPLVSDVSKALLHLAESTEMEAIRNKWFKENKCESMESSDEDYRLKFEDFIGLFMLTGCASMSAYIIECIIMWSRQKMPNEQSESSS